MHYIAASFSRKIERWHIKMNELKSYKSSAPLWFSVTLCSWEFKLVSVMSLDSVQTRQFVFFQTPERAKNMEDTAFLEPSCLKREM